MAWVLPSLLLTPALPSVEFNLIPGWWTSTFPARRNWRSPTAYHLQLCSWSTLIFCPASKYKTLWVEFWSIIPLSIYWALFTSCWDLMEFFLLSQNCTAKTQSWNRQFLESLSWVLSPSAVLPERWQFREQTWPPSDSPCLHPSTLNIRRLREKKWSAWAKCKFRSPEGRAIASCLQS